MSYTNYFTLEDDDAIYGLSKRFKVIQDSYSSVLDKSQGMTKTLDGNVDITMGAVYERHDYTIRVRQQEIDSDYGTLADIRYFYALNSPNDTPSNELTLIDHYGTSHQVVFIGQLSPKIVGVVLEGTEASFMVGVSFQFIG